MGINKSAVKVFLQESDRRPFSGRLLTLGKQDVYVTEPELKKIFAGYKRSLSVNGGLALSAKLDMAKSGFLSDMGLFSMLGFSQISSMDASLYEGADYVHDLNLLSPPEELQEACDCIFDGGTIEHVFHVPNALANIFTLLRVGGRIIHIAPSSNHIDHGFYMFSPTFFWDYYRANGYEINVCEVFRYTTDLYDGDWLVSDYVPGGLHRVSMGGLDDALYGVILIATKTEQTRCDVIPQQGMYSDDLWKGKSANGITRRVEDVIDPNFKEKGLGLKIKSRL
jgi:hypothetical protein